MRGRVAGTIFLTAVLLSQSGCWLFDPRSPRPGGGAGVNCLVPNTPDLVMTNVRLRYGSLQGVTCYTSMLGAPFFFHPDASDSISALPDTVYAHWTRDIEARVASNLASNATFDSMVIDSEYAAPVTSPDQRTQTRFFVYRLVVHSPHAAPDTLFSGLADITFFQGSDAQWHITDWVDKRDTSGSRTWGYLRRLYRVGF